jgi:hypothetical protein
MRKRKSSLKKTSSKKNQSVKPQCVLAHVVTALNQDVIDVQDLHPALLKEVNPTDVALAVLQMRGQLLAVEDVPTPEEEAIPETTEDHNVAEALGMSDLLQKEKGLEIGKPAEDAPRALSLAPEMCEMEVEMGAGTIPAHQDPALQIVTADQTVTGIGIARRAVTAIVIAGLLHQIGHALTTVLVAASEVRDLEAVIAVQAEDQAEVLPEVVPAGIN